MHIRVDDLVRFLTWLSELDLFPYSRYSDANRIGDSAQTTRTTEYFDLVRLKQNEG